MSEWLTSAPHELAMGFRLYLSGWRWLAGRPHYLLLLTLPLLLGLAILSYAGFALANQVLPWILGWIGIDLAAASWWATWLITAVAFIFGGGLVYLLYASVSLALAAPLFDIVALAIERDVRGGHATDLSLWEAFHWRTIFQEIKKLLFIWTVTLIILIIPGVNALTLFVTAFLVGWDFYDYPLARRGWTFSQRLSSARQDFWSIMGLGIWLVIPYLSVILYPFAIGGGTLLSLRKLQARGHL